MTNNESPSPLADLISRTIDEINSTLNADLDCDDPIDLIMDFADQIMLANDLCPIHRCDLEICIDDQLPECADLRNKIFGD